MTRFFNRREIETIYDSEQERRVVIYQRDDGSFGFVEDYFSELPLEHCWIESDRDTESFCDTLETVRREVYGRVSWLVDSAL